jgi:RNA polymerase sigma factor (sigma-70 family)
MVDYPRKGVLEHIREMAAAQRARESSDAELVAVFVAERDQAAFTEIVRRYGPLVLRVCRCVLRGHLQDAEDAFQATFLLLARNAGSIRKKDSLAEWLHGVAYRVAKNVRRGSKRRRQHERKAGAGPQRGPEWEACWREVQALLHEEIARLPKALREVFILCCLEEKSGAEAARGLGVKEGTVSSRLTKARQLLRRRLARRGVDLSVVLAGLAIWEGRAASASLSLASRTARAVIRAVTDNPAASGAISAGAAALAEGVNSAMFRTQCKVITILLLATSLTAGIVGLGMIPRPPAAAREALPPAASPAAAASQPKTNKDDSAAIVLSGRVVDLAEKAVQGAKLYLLDSTAWRSPMTVRATTAADGGFRFTVPRGQLATVNGRWNHLFLLAAAPGYGPAFCQLGTPSAAPEFTLRLLADDVPIKGRVLDLQGKPVAGAEVRIVGFRDPKKGDLTAFLQALKSNKEEGYPAENQFLDHFVHPGISSLFPKVQTDADGRFQLKGIGRERIAIMNISGPTIEANQVRVMTRPQERISRPAWRGVISGTQLTYYGSTFEHVAAPTTLVSGIVRDKDTGRPLADASVTNASRLTEGPPLVQAVTDKEGRYRLAGLPRSGQNRIKIAGPEGESYLEVEKSVPAAQGIEAVAVDAELKHGVRIKGRVTDKITGQPVSALVEYFAFRDNPNRNHAPGLWPRLSTKDDGSFEFIGLPGRGLIGVRAWSDRYLVAVGIEKFKTRGDVPWTIEGTVPGCFAINYHTLVEVEPTKDAASLTCNITVDPGRILKGTVIGPDGKPLAGARMGGVTESHPNWEDKTQPTAEFTVYAMKEGQRRNVLVLHEEKQLAGSLMIRGNEEGPLTIKLKPWAVLSGRLVTSDGQPRPNAELTLDRYGERIADPMCGYHRTRSFLTDKGGRFHIDALVPGLKYSMHFKNKKGALAGMIFEDMMFESGETKNLGDVQVKE